jgi:alpha-ketoglutarate-dependent taurine dioxygenase
MTEITITPIEDKVFGAVIHGVKLPSLTEEEFAEIHAAFLKYGFLVFPDQHLTEEENIAFGERFGKLEFGGLPIANQKKNEDGSFGEIIDLQKRAMRTNVGNEAWHTDSTYWPLSSKCALLSAVAVPDEGGGTELADTRAAYAALDQEMKDRIEHLSAFHSTQYSQANDIGDFPEQRENTIYHGEAYLRPLVKTHPETGVKNLFIGRHAFGIPGLSREESRSLIKQLMDFTVSDKSWTYTHEWTVGDTLLWDNRALLHRARPYDYTKPRVMTATRIAGDPESELAYYPEDPEAQAGRDALNAELAELRKESEGKVFGESVSNG